MSKLTQRLGLPRYEADELYRRAMSFYQKDDYDQAVDALNKAIDLLPTRSEYYAARGFVYLQDGVDEKALPDFDEAIRLYPFEMLAHYGRGMIAYRARDWDEALAHFNTAYAAQPDRPEVLYYLALVHHRQRSNVRALELMRAAVEGFEKANDKRRADANRWVRELEKLG